MKLLSWLARSSATGFLLCSFSAFGDAPDRTPPTAPANLKTNSITCTAVNLSWSASVDPANGNETVSGVVGYKVFRNGTLLQQVTTTSFSDTSVTVSATYTYGVVAVDGVGNISPTTTITVTIPLCPDSTPPNVPAAPSATSSVCNQVNVSWSAVTDRSNPTQLISGIKGYNVYRNGSLVTFVTITSITDTVPAGGTSYSYQVSAVDQSNNESARSSSSNVNVPSCPDLTPPNVPTGLSIIALDCSRLSLTWLAVSDAVGPNQASSGVKGYNIYRGGSLLAFVTTTNAIDTGLFGATGYSYQVSAVDNVNNESALSQAVPSTTPGCPDTTAPSVPSNLTISSLQCNQLTFSWSPSTDPSAANQLVSGVKGYNVYRGGAFLAFVTTPNAVETGLFGATGYSYQVSAVDNANNQSALSQAVTFTTPGCSDTTPPTVPSNLTISSLGCNQLTLSWSPSTDPSAANQLVSGVNGYSIYRNDTLLQFVTSTSFTDGNVVPGSSYRYRVSAVDGASNSSTQSSPLDVTIPSCASSPATDLRIFISNGKVGLEWSGTPGTLYQVENAVSFGTPWSPVDAPTTTFASTNLACDPTRMYRVALFTNTPVYLANYLTNTRDTAPPGVPAPLTVSAASPSQVNLSWSPVVDVGTFNSGQTYTSGLDRYLIYRDGIYLKSEPASATSSSDRSVSSGMQYIYSVAAIDKAGNVSLKASDSVAVCIFLQPASIIIGREATTGSFIVNAVGCSWSASVPTDSSWIQLQGPTSGNGSATINYSVAANPGTTDRVGTIQVQNKTFTLTQQGGGACTYSLSPSSFTQGTAGGLGTFNVTASSVCSWVATTTDSWLHTSTSGSGGGTVTYLVDANNGSARSGTVSVAGQSFTVNQDGVSCTYVLNPTSSSGGSVSFLGSFTVTAPGGCTWSPTVTDSWIHPSSVAGGVNYSVDANGGPARSGTISVGGQIFTVNQDAAPCTYLLNPTSVNGGSSLFLGSFTVTAPGGCGWSPSVSDGWIHASSVAGGVNYSVDANTAPGLRSGTISIAGQLFTITQAGVGCNYSINPDNSSISAGATPGSFSVTAGSGCSWSASTTNNWLHTTSTGAGDGTVDYTVDANTNSTGRVGAITAAGWTYVVNQAGVSCSYALSSSSAAFPSAGGSSNVAVIAGNTCSWFVSNVPSWLTISAGANGTGNGSVSYSVTPNSSTSPRAAIFSIAGNNYLVNQNGNQVPVANAGPDLSISIGSAANFSASGSADFDGSISSYQWNFGDGFTASGFSVSHTYSSLGLYTVTLTVTDNLGATATDSLLATIVALPDLTPPSIGLTLSETPSASGIVGLTATVSDNVGVTKTEFYRDGTLFTNLNTGPFNTTYDTRSLPNGSHTFLAKAYDAANNNNSSSVTVLVDNTAPTGTLTQPANGSAVSNTITLAANATDNVGGSGIAKVEFYFDNVSTPLGTATSSPYTATCDTKVIGNGNHSLYCIVYDVAGNQAASSSISISVNNPVAPGQAQWVQSILGSGYGKNVRITTVGSDNNGNVIACGTFVGAVDFGGQVISNASSSIQCFVAKYTPARVLLWANAVTNGTGLSIPYGIAINANGDVFVTGYFTVSEQIEGRTLTSMGYEDMFLFKFSGLNGSCAWTKTFGGTRSDSCKGITVDNAGNPILAGSFSDVVNFGTTVLTSSGGTDLFLGKFSAVDGSVIWVRKYGAAGDEVPSGITSGPDGNLYVTGQLTGDCSLGGTNMAAGGAADVFIAKYDNLGAHKWSMRYGSGGYNYGYGICVDSATNVVITGSFQSSTDFGSGTLLSPAAGSAVFLAKYSSSGANLWARMFGGTSGGSDAGRAVATDANNNIMLAGTVVSATSFDQVFLLGSTPDILVAKFSPTGSVQWAHRYGDTGMVDDGTGVTVSKTTGDIYLGGYFNGTADFGTGPISGPFNTQTAYLVKFGN